MRVGGDAVRDLRVQLRTVRGNPAITFIVDVVLGPIAPFRDRIEHCGAVVEIDLTTVRSDLMPNINKDPEAPASVGIDRGEIARERFFSGSDFSATLVSFRGQA